MLTPQNLGRKELAGIWTAFLILLVIAFVQGFSTTHDLLWPFDVDFDRDMSFVQGTLDGAYGRDPSYLHEWLWYNPLLFLIETGLVKLTGLPVSVVLVRAGAYLNMLGPIFFFLMCIRLAGPRIALAALLSYLFLAPGKTMLVIGATYTPWLYPSEFILFAFYLDIILCYKAFSSGKYGWFALLGGATGISFLGHGAPALIMVLIMTGLQTENIVTALRQKDYGKIKKYGLQGLCALLGFGVASAPVFYYILGKYHLHILNREPAEFTEELFHLNHLWGLFKANFSAGLVIAVMGAIYFYREFPRGLLRKILLGWFYASAGMYFYTTAATSLNRHGVQLPPMVPSFHYFMYLKALQSVFFGFGLVFLLSRLPVLLKYGPLIVVSVALAYFPVYREREDFTNCRDLSIAKQDDTDKQEVYRYIVQHVPPDGVILCELDHSLFPVVATGRKLVSTAYTFSNPYVNFVRRENHRVTMLDCIRTGRAEPLKTLLNAYEVSYVLLSSQAIDSMAPGATPPGRAVLHNRSFTLFALK